VSADLTPNRLSRAIERRRWESRAFIDLTVSNPTRAELPYPDDLLAPLASREGLVYAPEPLGIPAARQAVSDDYARRGLDVPAERIVLTASTSEAYSVIFKLLCDPGDEVAVPRPSYPLFEHLTRLDALRVRGYDLEAHGAWSIDLASLESALGERTRVVLLVSPNNPTGSVVRQDELERIVALCAPRGIAVVIDEVFADYDLAAPPSCQRGWAANVREGLAFGLGGLSKSIGLPQVKLGWMALAGGETNLRAAIERLELVCDTYLSVSTPVQLAAGELLARGAAVRDAIQARVSANYRRALELSRASACSVAPADGGWYAVLAVPTLGSEEDLVVQLLEERDVLAHPGFFFDFPRETFLVVSLLTPEPEFADGISRIVRHFDCRA
jgi:aspartate/methionine/tyrosine aminotransferase